MIHILLGDEVICRARVADNFLSRLRGLMFQKELDREEGLLIKYSKHLGSRSVHGFFMRFPLDLVFLDANGRVLEIGFLPKWGYYNPVSKGSAYVLEVNKGFARERGLKVGDTLILSDLDQEAVS